MNVLGAGGMKISKKPMDPLNTSTPYTYSKLAYGNEYQIKTDWEGESVAYNSPHSYVLLSSSSEGDQGGVLIDQVQASS